MSAQEGASSEGSSSPRASIPSQVDGSKFRLQPEIAQARVHAWLRTGFSVGAVACISFFTQPYLQPGPSVALTKEALALHLNRSRPGGSLEVAAEECIKSPSKAGGHNLLVPNLIGGKKATKALSTGGVWS